MSKEYRLLRSKDFRFRGENFQKMPFKIVYKINNLSHSRLGLVVSKKFSKSAVVRNSAKRTIREFFRTSSLKELGVDIVVILSRSIGAVSQSNLNADLMKTLLHIERNSRWGQIKREL